MIKLKISFGKDEHESTFDTFEGENLKAAIERATKQVPLGEFKLEDVFNVVVNGHIIDDKFWGKILTKESDNILITPKLRDGEFGQIFKQLVIIAAVVTVAWFFPPAAALGNALLVAGTAIGATLAMNALIPPPSQDLGANSSGLAGGIESSQMYAITGQSNQMKRLAPVAKAYGSHRMFPVLAATPYTEISVDPTNGEIVQDLCAVYDFGLGTPQISDIKIGDTPLTSESFVNFQYRLVDPNRPDVDQDEFDEPLNKEFSLYKGDRSTTQLSLALEDGTEVIQNTANNPDTLKPEIILDFICPNGLFGYSSGGQIGERRINLEIDFAPVGSSDWKPYNDLTAVDSYDIVGGTDVSTFSYPHIPINPGSGDFNTYYGASIVDDENYWQAGSAQPTASNISVTANLRYDTNKIVVQQAQGQHAWEVGRAVFHYGFFLGIITAINPYGSGVELTLDRIIGNTYYPAFAWLGKRAYGSGAITYNPTDSGVHMVRSSSTDPSLASIVGSRQSAVYASFRFTPKAAGQYQIRVRRISTEGDFNQQVADNVTWAGITTAFNRSPVNTTKRHVFMELKIRATNQLNGNIQNLSAVTTQVVDFYDPNTEAWYRTTTSNPAWIFCDLLTSEVNKKAVSKSRLHLPSILEWAEYCEEVPTPPPSMTYLYPRFSANFILDYEATLQQVLQQVGGASQASLNVIEGKYGVLVDRFKTTPVQIFTPRNSRDFSSTRFYSPRPHGVKVKYIDPQLGWEVSEVIVYDNGYNEENATEFDELTSFACTNQEQAWRFGRYMIAQNKLRQETINIFVDFENLICTRGDYVQITQDVMQVGGRPARVKAIDGNEITIDDSFDIDISLTYRANFRTANGEVKQDIPVTPISARVFELTGDLPEVGDLIVIGEIGKVVFDCIVKSISPNDDLSAQLTLVERANDIFAYESEGEIPEYDPQISITSRPDFSPPRAVVGLAISNLSWECAETQSGYNYFVEVTWDIPAGSVYEYFEIWYNDGRGYRLAANTNAKYFKTNIDQSRLGSLHGIKVVAVAASGRKLDLVAMPEVTFTPTVKSEAPSDVPGFGMAITNQTLQLAWSPIVDCDVSKYELRYSPDVNDVWEASVPLQTVDRNVNSVTVQARTGVYYVKAIDFAGNKSATASRTITTIPNLFDLNVIETFNDAPTFPGEFDQTEKLGDAVVLRQQVIGDANSMQFFPVGFYELFNLLDLGDIYSVRLASLIRADGYRFGELMSAWDTLDEVESLSTSEGEDWNVVAEYRATNEILAMADWAHLYDIENINEGLGQGFTDWRPIPTIGDATGRVFQFRVRLESLTPNVTPRLFDATIKADMPDRVDSFENLVSSATDPYQVTYAKRFHGPDPSPNVQITIDNGQAGDHWEFENKNLEGFQIRFYDIDDNQVSRTFDVQAKGYGSRHTVTI